jgi:hypothetical protein
MSYILYWGTHTSLLAGYAYNCSAILRLVTPSCGQLLTWPLIGRCSYT